MSRVSGWLLLVIAVTAAAAAQDVNKLALSQTFVSPECHVRFSYPENWHVVMRKRCEFRIQRSEIKDDKALDADIYGIDVSVSERPFENAAQKAGFELRDGKWQFRGEAEVAADPITAGPYKGLLAADFPCRTYDENGYAGMGDCAAAVVGANGRAASFHANAASAELLPGIVQSFRFEDATSK